MFKFLFVWGIMIGCSFCPAAAKIELVGHALLQERTVKLKLPPGRPQQFAVQFEFAGQQIDVQFYKSSTRGPNTRFLIDEGKPRLTLAASGEDGGYLGHSSAWPGLRIKGRLTGQGLEATISNPNGQSVVINPIGKSKRHRIAFAPVGRSSKPTARNVFSEEVSAKGLRRKFQSTATLRPNQVMKCVEYEIGVEIGSRAFEAKTAYQGNVEVALKIAASTSANLDKRYLHATGIKHTLGTVVIRTHPKTDPLRNSVIATGSGGAAARSLVAFTDYWNAHPEIVGTTHDLACYHTFYAPSGLAYGNSVGGRRRYATVGGRGATSWADGTLCHEFGHSWGLRHTNDSGLFYESKPRSRAGARSSGGKLQRISVMVGDAGNIGRLASDEADQVLKTRSKKLQFGTPFLPGPTKPFGKRDLVNLTGASITIDVIKNDYDVNNDVLDVKLLDTVSHRGGRITLSLGTGPGGRNEVHYAAPSGGLNGQQDVFHYTVFDTSGRRDFGAVYLESTSVRVDLNATAYSYDFGPRQSPVGKGFTLITPQTTGDIGWSKKVNAVDRGKSKQMNVINQDFVYSSQAVALSHKIANGTWVVTLNMGDREYAHDRMGLKAENKRVARNVNSPVGKTVYVGRRGGSQKPISFEVEVKDGSLDLEFFDAGGGDANWVLNRMSLQRKQ